MRVCFVCVLVVRLVPLPCIRVVGDFCFSSSSSVYHDIHHTPKTEQWFKLNSFSSLFLWKKRLSAYFGTKTVIQDVFCMIDCSIRLLSWPPPSISNGKRIDQLLLSKNDIWLVLASSDSNMHRYCGFHLTPTGCNPKQSFAEITFKITYNPWKEMFRHRII